MVSNSHEVVQSLCGPDKTLRHPLLVDDVFAVLEEVLTITRNHQIAGRQAVTAHEVFPDRVPASQVVNEERLGVRLTRAHLQDEKFVLAFLRLQANQDAGELEIGSCKFSRLFKAFVKRKK